MPVQTQLQQRRGTAASWTSTNPTLAAGEIGFESDTGKIKIGNGSTAWNALAYTASSTAVTYLFNATAAQTTFSGADANGLTLAYTVGSEQVYLNGVLQVRGSDYTATNGTSIVLTSGALVSDVLNVIAFSALALSDTYTQAQADAKFFQTANAFLAGKNKFINGDFSINQRGFTSTTSSAVYIFDRFNTRANEGTTTFSAQTFTAGAAPVAGYEFKNYLQIVSTGQTGTFSRSAFTQPIESVRTFAGQTATISFWARATSGTPSVASYASQDFGTGGSPSVSVDTAGQKLTITTSWARYSFTFSIPSISGKTLGTNNNDNLRFFLFTSAGSDWNAVTDSLGIQSTTIQFAGIQVEAGSIATPFQTATGTIQGELAAAQRYYVRYSSDASNPLQSYGFGVARATTFALQTLSLPVEMRIAPVAIEYGGNLELWDGVNAATAITTLGLDAVSSKYIRYTGNTASGLTQYRPYTLRAANTASAYVGFTSEL
jgi:hypothetical protein